MPIYEYRCQACGHELDALQKISDAHLTDCPSCEQPNLKRLISAPSFRLKGSGWYETDFKSDKDKQRNLADSGGAGKGDGDGGKGDGGAKSDTAAGDSGKGEAKKDSGDKAKDKSKSESRPSDTKKSTEPVSKAKGSGSEAA